MMFNNKLTIDLGPERPPLPATLENSLVAMQGRPINEETIREIRSLARHYTGEDQPVWWSNGSSYVHIGDLSKAVLRRLNLTEHEIDLHTMCLTAYGRSGGGNVRELMR